MRRNIRDIPFQPCCNREIGSSMFGFDDQQTPVSYAPAKNHAVVLLSNMQRDSAVDTTTGKPHTFMD
jgi:hypothetical protein